MRIAASRVLPGAAWQELEDVVVGPRPDAEAVIVTNEPVDLDAMPHLRLVANFGVGYDRVDVAACRARGIAVTNTPDVLTDATADFAFALVLAVRRRLVEGDRYVRSGAWNDHWSTPFALGRDLRGSTLAVIGFGRIGQAVARRGEAFGMHVVPVRRGEEDLDQVLRTADVVSLHVPLTSETNGLISRERLALLRDGATLINTARGAVVDEDALVAELVAGRIGAGLDVFVHEPRVPEALLDLPNVVLAPHLASATEETRAAMTRIVVDNVLAAGRGEPLLTPVG